MNVKSTRHATIGSAARQVNPEAEAELPASQENCPGLNVAASGGVVKITIASKLARGARAVLQGNQGIGLHPQRSNKQPLEPDEKFARLVEVVTV